MVRVRSKRWCFTLNNYTEEEELMLRDLVGQGMVTYLLYGHEVGEEGTPHLQGYLETKQKYSLRTLKGKLMNNRIHLEKARGSLEQNQVYCRKQDDDVFEDGSPMQQGRRSDLDEIRTLLDGGVTVNEISESHFSKWVIYRRAFQEYVTQKLKDRSWKTQVFVLWGNTGTGKTRYCFDQIMDTPWWMPGDYQWFDGYKGQQIVIIDDYRGEYPLALFLKLLDRYPMSVPIKGGFIKWLPKKVYITSNIPPRQWYPTEDFRSIAALERRFTKVDFIIDSLY
jgi:hypothetical protein